MLKNKLKSGRDDWGDEDFSDEEDDLNAEELEEDEESSKDWEEENEAIPEDDEEEDSWENKELDEYEDEIYDDLTNEVSEERGGYVHLRYRDSLGRFASPNTDLERKQDIEMDRKIEKFIRNYHRKIQLPYNEKILLLRLVDDFSNRKQLLDKNGYIDPKISHFKQLSYHQIFSDFSSCHSRHLGRSAFSQFINRMIDKGLVKKIKHGKKLFLKITKKGLDAVYRFWDEYPGESWRRP